MSYTRKYLVWLLSITLILVLVSFVILGTAPGTFIVSMPFLAVYFCIVTGLQHLLVTKAMMRSPKTFVQIFLGTTVGVLFIHLVVLASFLLTHASQGRRFLIAFCIGYVVYLVFETTALVKLVEDEKKRRKKE